MAGIGCRVFAYDPTVDAPASISPNINVSEVGLGRSGERRRQLQDSGGVDSRKRSRDDKDLLLEDGRGRGGDCRFATVDQIGRVELRGPARSRDSYFAARRGRIYQKLFPNF